jgi:Lrp/AsnC family transcriptional regulator
MPEIDRYDLLILQELQQDAGQPTAEIAEKVGLSLSPCWRRIKRMRDDGVIEKDVALLNAKAIGLEIEAVASVSLRNQHRDDRDSFQDWAQKCPEIVECLSISGERDYLLRILVPDLSAYEHFLSSELLAQPCVNSASSSFVLKKIKKTTALPLPSK